MARKTLPFAAAGNAADGDEPSIWGMRLHVDF